MGNFLIGNAPCSWGMLEFEQSKGGEQIQFRQMLDELAETGYTGTELGDWGYMPTDPAVLKHELGRRNISMLGAFVPVALKDEGAHRQGIHDAVKIAKLLASVAGNPSPFLVLADANGTDPERTRLAGRVPASAGLSDVEWQTVALGVKPSGKRGLAGDRASHRVSPSLCRLHRDTC